MDFFYFDPDPIITPDPDPQPYCEQDILDPGLKSFQKSFYHQKLFLSMYLAICGDFFFGSFIIK